MLDVEFAFPHAEPGPARGDRRRVPPVSEADQRGGALHVALNGCHRFIVSIGCNVTFFDQNYEFPRTELGPGRGDRKRVPPVCEAVQ